MHLLTWSKNLTDETTDRLDKLIDKKLTDRKNDEIVSLICAKKCNKLWCFSPKKECSSF
jgi:hypothetical protein